MNYIHITDNERRRIERLREGGKSIRLIAKLLRRSPNVISEEITRNSVKGSYVARKAKHKAYVRRRKSKIQCMKVAMDPELREYVTKHIEDHQSPQGISVRMKNVERDKQYASTKAIYKFIRSVHGRRIEKHLYSKAVRRKGGKKRAKSTVWDDGRVSIEKRPKKVLLRKEFGHFEGDFIESGKEGTGCILVLVERKTRYVFLQYLEDRSTGSVNDLVARMLKGVPVKSITLDNDLSFQKHEKLSEIVGADIFFCHTYCSNEKGSVENRNKALRRYLPKRSDLSSFTPGYIAWVEAKLRGKFMVCLTGKSPREAFDGEIERHMKKHPSWGGIIKVNLTDESVLLQG